MHRYELTDAQWEQLASFFPDPDHDGGPGPPWKDHRTIVNGILWHLHTGAPWPDTSERYGPWKTLFDRFQRWRRDGTWANILDAPLLRLDRAGRLDRDLWLVDASIIRASRAAAGAKKKNPDQPPVLGGPVSLQVQEPQDHALGRSRGGFGTKVHLVCDGHGIVLAVWATPGQEHESQALAIILLRARRPRRAGRRRWPRRVAADKGYSYPGIRAWLRRHHIGPVIPARKDQPREENFDRLAYRRRSRIEQVVGWYKECRALGTRSEKLAVNYVALWMVAIIEKLLRKHLKWLKT
jgi:transposase